MLTLATIHSCLCYFLQPRPETGNSLTGTLFSLPLSTTSDLKFHFSGSVEVSFLKLPRKFRVVLQRAPEVAGCRPSYRHPDARLSVISTWLTPCWWLENVCFFTIRDAWLLTRDNITSIDIWHSTSTIKSSTCLRAPSFCSAFPSELLSAYYSYSRQLMKKDEVKLARVKSDNKAGPRSTVHFPRSSFHDWVPMIVREM